MDAEFHERVERVASKRNTVERSLPRLRGWFRPVSFLASFALISGAFYIIANLNVIQSYFTSSTPVGVLAIACGLTIALLGGGMLRSSLALAHPNARKADPKWPIRASRASGTFAGLIVSLGPQAILTEAAERLKTFGGQMFQ